MPTSDLLGKKMLLAADGSEEAELATRAAVELAENTGSELHVVYVEPLPDFMKKNGAGTPGYDRELYEKIEGEGRETLRKLVWRVTGSWRIRSGGPPQDGSSGRGDRGLCR